MTASAPGNKPFLVSPLQSDAWAAWNASYHEANGEAYRALAQALYEQDLSERIRAQLARLDEQNAKLDALLSADASTRVTSPGVCVSI